MRFEGDGLRILSFDTECRPLSYLGNDFTTAEVTAIAAAWVQPGGRTLGMRCWLLGVDDPVDMLVGFAALWEKADMVTGHYVRGFDNAVVNGAMLDNGLPPLSDKLTHDTKLDLVKRKYVSASQENLAASLGVAAPKVKMNQQMWREANRLTPEGIALTRKRVVGDVRQHVQLRQALIDLGWLGAPRVWRSSGHLSGTYTP